LGWPGNGDNSFGSITERDLLEYRFIHKHNVAFRSREPLLQHLAVFLHDRFADEYFDEIDASVERAPNLAKAVDDNPLLLAAAAAVAQLRGQFDSRIVAARDWFGHDF
jgi:hypothetical protein